MLSLHKADVVQARRLKLGMIVRLLGQSCLHLNADHAMARSSKSGKEVSWTRTPRGGVSQGWSPFLVLYIIYCYITNCPENLMAYHNKELLSNSFCRPQIQEQFSWPSVLGSVWGCKPGTECSWRRLLTRVAVGWRPQFLTTWASPRMSDLRDRLKWEPLYLL